MSLIINLKRKRNEDKMIGTWIWQRHSVPTERTDDIKAKLCYLFFKCGQKIRDTKHQISTRLFQEEEVVGVCNFWILYSNSNAYINNCYKLDEHTRGRSSLEATITFIKSKGKPIFNKSCFICITLHMSNR